MSRKSYLSIVFGFLALGGYWRQVEEYVRAHSEVEFSHSICPECMKKLYPELGLRERGER